MSPPLWIALGVTIAVVLCYVLGMRVLARNSRETDKLVDFSKIRPWQGDDRKD